MNTITYGSRVRKAKVSFDFLDKNRKGYINYSDIEIVISEVHIK
jgi:Ca2+-binding EF-hand superfamily protein